MEQMRYLIGVDAGATKTHYALYDRAEDRFVRITGGPANHEVLPGGFEELEAIFADQFKRLLSPLGLTPAEIGSAALGVAGVDTKRQHEIVSGILQRLGFAHFVLANDASLGIKAESSTGTGISAVNGSGFSIFGINAAGRTMQVGGFGDYSGDLGGGSYYASRVAAAVYGSFFKGERATAMAEPMLAFLKADKETLMEKTAARLEEDGPALRQALCRILFWAAGRGDAAAREILDRSAAAYAGAVRGAAEGLAMLGGEPVEVILVGSVFIKGEDPYLIEQLDRLLNVGGSAFRLKPITADPVAGALFWAYEAAGLQPGETVQQHCRQLAQQA